MATSGSDLKAAARSYVCVSFRTCAAATMPRASGTFKHEADDGYDTVEWAAALPYSDGSGMSRWLLRGATQMLAAIARPPHLAGICPSVTGSNYHSNWTYQGGAFQQWFNESWTYAPAWRRTRSTETSATARTRRKASGNCRWARTPCSTTSPGAGITVLLNRMRRDFLDWLAHPSEDAYGSSGPSRRTSRRLACRSHHSRRGRHLTGRVPQELHRCEGTWRNRCSASGSTPARGRRRSCGGRTNESVTSTSGLISQFDYDAVAPARDDHLFKGAQNEFGGQPAKIFVTGANWSGRGRRLAARPRRYTGIFDSPARQIRCGEWHVVNGTPVATELRSVCLLIREPVALDPRGPLCCDAAHMPPGPRDQRQVEAREDVLVYSTAPLASDLRGHAAR